MCINISFFFFTLNYLSVRNGNSEAYRDDVIIILMCNDDIISALHYNHTLTLIYANGKSERYRDDVVICCTMTTASRH